MQLLARPLIAGLRWTLGDTSRELLRPESVRTILLAELTRLGDAVTLLHLLRVLRSTFPAATFTVLVDDTFAGLLEVLATDVRFVGIRRPDHPFGVGRAMAAARREQADLAISVSPAYRNAAVVLASGARLKAGYLRTGGSSAPSLRANPVEGIGFRAPEGIAYKGEGWLERRWKLLDLLGVTARSAVETFALPATLHNEVLTRLRDHHILNGRPHIVIHPFSSWGFRAWPAQRYVSLIDRVLHNLEVDVVVLGGAGDEHGMHQFRERFSGSGRVACLSSATLVECATVIAGAALLVGNDSGPLHLASVLGTPAIGVYGPSDPRHTAPPRIQAIYHKVECSPCGQRTCIRRQHPCLSEISVDEVMASLTDLLRGASCRKEG